MGVLYVTTRGGKVKVPFSFPNACRGKVLDAIPDGFNWLHLRHFGEFKGLHKMLFYFPNWFWDRNLEIWQDLWWLKMYLFLGGVHNKHNQYGNPPVESSEMPVLLAAHVNRGGFRSFKVVCSTVRSDCIIVLSASVSSSLSIVDLKKKKKNLIILCFVLWPLYTTVFLVVNYVIEVNGTCVWCCLGSGVSCIAEN